MDGLYTATESWQNGTLTSDSVIQCKTNSLLVHSGGSDPSDPQTGTLLQPGESIAMTSGKVVRYRAHSPAGATFNVTQV